MPAICKGCNTEFDLFSLHRHLSRTNKPACLSFANSTDDTVFDCIPEPSLSDDDSEQDPSNLPPQPNFLEDDSMGADNHHLFSNFDVDMEPVDFDGDFAAANYTASQLGQGDDELSDEVEDDEEYEEPQESDVSESSGESDDEDALNALAEDTWEAPRPSPRPPPSSNLPDSYRLPSAPQTLTIPNITRRLKLEDRLREAPFVVKFGGRAGEPLLNEAMGVDADTQYREELGDSAAPWFPFTSQVDWEVGRWAKLRGPGSNAFNEFLKIPGVVEALGLSFKTTEELNKIIDTKLPGRPVFNRAEAVVAGEAHEFYHRDILECIRALWGDPDLSTYLIMCPERHYTDHTRQKRLFHSMHTGRWWWATQKRVEQTHPGATIIPVILSSDKTQLTVFGNKTAYPVYITIGNIPKEIRRKPSRGAYLLLAYLPTSKLSSILTKAGRRRALANLFHACMGHITAPLRSAGVDGMRVVNGIGVPRRGHPILACYVADYPEQTMTTTAKGNRCPGLCPTAPEELGDDLTNHPFLELAEALRVLEHISQGPTVFAQACQDAGMKPVPEPFWKELPYTNIFQSMTPDILHQLYQGLIKHLIAWLIAIVGKEEIDARCRRFPPNHNIRLFMRGISGLSRVTGTEHQMIGRFLLGLIIDIPLPGNGSSGKLCAAVRSMLDFIYLAQYPLHSTDTLSLLRSSLTNFHNHKEIFVELGACPSFRIPKLHACQHFPIHFENFGTADNFNTEYTERLHIDLAKNAYRSTNRRDELPQMVLWLDRKEKLHRHTKYIKATMSRSSAPPLLYDLNPGVTFERTMKMTIHPTHRSVKFSQLLFEYGAVHFREALARYVVSIREPELNARSLVQEAQSVYLPFARVPVWHRIKWTTPDIYNSSSHGTVIVDSAHVNPARTDKRGHIVPGRFDTVLVNVNDGGRLGVKGYRIGQVRAIFSLHRSKRYLNELFQAHEQPYVARHLAYIEWFTPFSAQPEGVHGLYKISRSCTDGTRDSSVVPLTDIRRSVHLYPRFGPVVPPGWTSSNVLEEAKYFYVNCFSDRHAYFTVF
ncbi:hypothetical protein V5O48_011694 [Marasmius crinis-equi]|uniref:Uncharacterized protein n=1 Tax=Marasmius crinis-equi TaxID=585013 RepID=A0ABR3F551_9AGAR